MEGDDILAAMDSLWFHSNVLLHPPSKHKQGACAEEPKPGQQQDSAETTCASSGQQAPSGVEEAAHAVATRRGGAAARCLGDREWDERVVAWHKELRRRTRAAAAARCSRAQARMPSPGEGGVAMKVHLRSWAHAVACSVR